MEIIQANESQAAALMQNAKAFELYAAQVSSRVASRYAWWEVVRNFAGRFDVNLADVLGPDLVDLNAKCDEDARAWATVVKALNGGAAELVGREDGGQLKLAVVVKGVLPQPLQAWPLVPLIVVGVIVGGGWLLLDGWLDARKKEADAQMAHEANVAKWAELAAKAQAMGGDAMRQLQTVIDAANGAAASAAADPNSLLGKLGRGVTAVTDAVVGAVKDTGGMVILAILAAWALSKSKGKGGLFA